jgi:hypothetical protein
MSLRIQTWVVAIVCVALISLGASALWATFWKGIQLAPPAITYVQSSVTPYEVTVCAGDPINLNYIVEVSRPTVAAVSQHYVPLGESLARQIPASITTTALWFHQDIGRYNLTPTAIVPADLAPGSYNRYVVAQFEGAMITSYRQVVHVEACE